MNNTTSEYIKACSIAGSHYGIIVAFPSRKYVLNQVITLVASCALTIPVIILNGVTVLTILKSRQLKAKVCHFLVLIQSIVDSTVGLLTLPLFTYVHAREILGSPDCVVSFLLTTIAFVPWGLSLAALCGLTFERYMGVLHPFVHRAYLTRKIFLAYMSCVLLVTFVLVPLAVAFKTFYYIFCVVYSIIPMLLHTFCYSRIFYSTRKRLHPDNVIGDCRTATNSANRIRRQYLMKEYKLAGSCALVVITFHSCCIPGEVLNLYYLKKDLIMYRVVMSWYTTALGVNAALNSVIFFWTRPALRKEAFKVLKNMYYGD